MSTQDLREVQRLWFKELSAVIRFEQRKVSSERWGTGKSYGAFLSLLPADLLAMITLQELLHLIVSDKSNEMTYILAASKVGSAVKQHVMVSKSFTDDEYDSLAFRVKHSKLQWENRAVAQDPAHWEEAAVIKLGALLVKYAVENCTLQIHTRRKIENPREEKMLDKHHIQAKQARHDESLNYADQERVVDASDGSRWFVDEETVPAFIHSQLIRPKSKKTVGMINVHDLLMTRLSSTSLTGTPIKRGTEKNKELFHVIDLTADHLRPMLCPPKRWSQNSDTGTSEGGYLVHKISKWIVVDGFRVFVY